ncbi:hypothetical protein [Mangrovicoccus sp. HB161399]|uniref:hypothetical protein n=1 Tax=Mangrovicoccus sp. HB161399 TaxID=2720392 RepID=UPI001553FB9A|nr:hypothetical protein [Mangrovicoccus sp. HB161399]
MQVLEGAMAFAVAMIIFSTMATGIVEILLRTLNTRPALLRKAVMQMLDRMVDQRMPHLKDPENVLCSDLLSDAQATDIAKALGEAAAAAGKAVEDLDPKERLAVAKHLTEKWSLDWEKRRMRLADEMTCSPVHFKVDAHLDGDGTQGESIFSKLKRGVQVVLPDRMGRKIGTGHGYQFLQRRLLVQSLSTYAFLQRLAGSELGSEIVEHGMRIAKESPLLGKREAVRQQWQDWQRMYERYRATVSEQFRRKAQLWTVLISVLLAPIFNIHAVRLVNAVMNDDALRQSLIAMGEEVGKQYSEQLAQLNATLDDLEAHAGEAGVVDFAAEIDTLKTTLAGFLETLQPLLEQDSPEDLGNVRDALAALSDQDVAKIAGQLRALTDAMAPILAPLDAEAAGGADAARLEALTGIRDALDAFAKALGREDFEQQLKDLRAALAPVLDQPVLPVGLHYWPHCMEMDGVDLDPLCTERANWTGQERTWAWISWTFNALLAGILIGLGGPFWYKVFSSLSQLTNALRAFGGGTRNPENIEAPSAADEGTSTAEKKRAEEDEMDVLTRNAEEARQGRRLRRERRARSA